MKYNHFVVMFVIMLVSGILSTMNMWVDKYEDMRFTLNDVYMISLMTGWMMLFMGLFYRNVIATIFGLIMILMSILCIRMQLFITEKQYRMGMIPHHSMAVHVSKQLLKKDNSIQSFLKHIIKTQSNEIIFLNG
jgi:uncharacterized protein (DUF305 family)